MEFLCEIFKLAGLQAGFLQKYASEKNFAVKSEVLGMSSARSTYRIFGKNVDQLLYL